MVCQFVQISPKDLDTTICIDEAVSLNSIDKFEKNVILTEGGILPHIQSSVDYMICTSHLNTILKQHLLLKKRNRCMLPSTISSHPDTDHSSCEFQGRPPNKKRRKSSRLLTLNDAYAIHKHYGVVFPIETPICAACNLQIRNFEEYLLQEEDTSRQINEVTCTIMKDVNMSSDTGTNIHQSNGDSSEMQADFDSYTCTVFSQNTECTMTSSEFIPSSQENDMRQENLAIFLESCKVLPIGAPRGSWNTYTNKTKRKYLNHFKECLSAVIDCFFPSNKDVIEKFFKEFGSQEVDVDGSSSMLDSLVESYQKAETWQVKRQILSVISVSKTYHQVAEIVPETTEYRYYIAKKHAISQGCALPPSEKNDIRHRMDPVRLDSFLDYITSSHIIKDLPFGQRKLKTSDGKVIETPNIIRSMAPQAIIDQYKQYCEELDIEPLGTSTMFKILQNCTATIRKSLEGLDYFLAEGGRCIDDLTDVIWLFGPYRE